MGTALSTIKPPKMPPETKQEPLLAFIRRWEKKLGTFTDHKQGPRSDISTIETDREKEDGPGLACPTNTVPGSPSRQRSQSPNKSPRTRSVAKSGVAGLSCLPRRSSRAATKLKTKAHDLSVRIARKSPGRPQPGMEDDFVKQRNCALQVANLFPDISPQHLRDVAASLAHDAAAVINFIADEQEAGRSYPKKTSTTAKRKRGNDDGDEDDSEEVREAMARAKRRFDGAGRRAVKKSSQHAKFIAKMITRDFPFAPIKYVQDLLAKNDQLLLPTYLELEETIHDWDKLAEKPWDKNFDPTRLRRVGQREEAELDRAIQKAKLAQTYTEELEEMKAARRLRSLRDKMRLGKEANGLQPQQHHQLQGEGSDNQPAGEMAECQCCFDDQPLTSMVHCGGEETHFFCVVCARRNAEHTAGLAQFELKCMAMDSCSGGFSHSQRRKFLDKKLTAALDRLEANHYVALAGLEDLVKCPFCDYAELYPPVEENRIFECVNTRCMKRSCRLCQKEDHLPLTCEEFAKEHRLSARRTIEEARSEAVIRKCNKCNNPFIKEMGCNKMTCPVPSCRNVQCYICSKSCNYDHFNRDSGCVLYDNIEARHEEDLKKAEEVARQKVIEQNPDISDEQLKIEMSNKVKRDDDRRRSKDAHLEGGEAIFYEDWRARRLNGVPQLGVFPGVPQVGAPQQHPPALPDAAAARMMDGIRFMEGQLNVHQPPLAANEANQAPAQAGGEAIGDQRIRQLQEQIEELRARHERHDRQRHDHGRHDREPNIEEIQRRDMRRIQEGVRARLGRQGARGEGGEVADNAPARPRAQEAAAAHANENKKPQVGALARTRSRTRQQRENNDARQAEANALDHRKRQGLARQAPAPVMAQQQVGGIRRGLAQMVPGPEPGAHMPQRQAQPIFELPAAPHGPAPLPGPPQGALDLDFFARFRHPQRLNLHPPPAPVPGLNLLGRGANAAGQAFWDAAGFGNFPWGAGRGRGAGGP